MMENWIRTPGEKIQQFVPVYQTGLKLPVTVICGKEKGKTILITSGIHCCEYSGIQASIELAAEIPPNLIKGQIILIHPVNFSGFQQCNYSSRVPEDNKNLNRVFPGKINGSYSEQIAAFLVNEFQSKADYCIDMHGGNTQEALFPYAYYVTAAKQEVMEKARQMAQRIRVDVVVASKIAKGGYYNYAGASGIPSILIERGCSGLWSKEEVTLYKEDIRNVMRYLEILVDGKEVKKYDSQVIEKVYCEEAVCGGCWYPQKNVGSRVRKGELAGTIKDCFGKTVEKIYFKDSGIVLYQTCSLCIKKREEAVVYGKLKN